MLYKFGEKQYIDVDSITSLRWLETEAGNAAGIVVLNGAKISVNEEEFKNIEKAFLWKHGTCTYDADFKKLKYPGGE